MRTIQVVLDETLLKATDSAARRARVNRSSLIREALRRHLSQLRTAALEERDRAGYRASTGAEDASGVWEAEASWSED